MTTGQDPEDPSLYDLKTLRDSGLPETTRYEAFARMLVRERGWWGPGTIAEHTLAYAEVAASRHLAALNLPPDKIDYQAVSQDALLALRSDATKIISDNPRGWYHGVIRILVRHAAAEEKEHLTAVELDENLPAPEANSIEAAEKEAERLAEIDRRMTAAFNRLTPSLRRVAFLLYIDRLSREEVAGALGISRATLRKRIARLIEQCQKMVETKQLPEEN